MNTLEKLADEELALRYIDGCDRAFDILLQRNQQKLFNYIMFVVRDYETANDIFQDTFLKVVVKLRQGQYTDSGKFAYWLTRIAHNVIMDWYRAKPKNAIIDAECLEDTRAYSSADIMDINRENRFVNEQVQRDVVKIMNSLPAPQREVVYMRFYQEIPFKEIAEITGVSINTALGRMRYAILNMRRIARQNDISLALEA